MVGAAADLETPKSTVRRQKRLERYQLLRLPGLPSFSPLFGRIRLLSERTQNSLPRIYQI